MAPTPRAAAFVWPDNWRAVLCLTRLVVHPDVPQNGASFLLANSVKLIQRGPRWECLVTYADEGQGHTGAIYHATGWEYLGLTEATDRWITTAGRMVSPPRDRPQTAVEMRALGYELALTSRKHRFRKVLKRQPVETCG